MKKVFAFRYTFTLLFGLLFSGNVFSTQFYLSSTGNDGNNGLTPATAVATFAKAYSLAAANENDIINVSGIIQLSATETVAKRLTIQGTSRDTDGFRGDGTKRLFMISDRVVTMKNLKFENSNHETGTINDGGGAILIGGTAAIPQFSGTNLLFSDNHTAGTGGAICVIKTNGTFTLENCVFTGNSASRGGAVGILKTAYDNITLQIKNCVFDSNSFTSTTNNTAGGSAIWSSFDKTGNTLNIINSTITRNSATTAAGGSMYFTATTAEGNNTLNIINCTVAKNTSSASSLNSGAGIYISQSNLKLNLCNSIVEGNTVSGGNYSDFGAYFLTPSATTLLIANSFVGRYTADPIGATDSLTIVPNTKIGYAVGSTENLLKTKLGTYNSSLGYYPLLSTSPAINYGNFSYLSPYSSTDQIGNARSAGNCSAGAVEYTPVFTGAGAWTNISNWNTNAVPASSTEIIINGAATIDSNVEIAGMIINAGKSLTVNAGKQLTVTNTLANSGTLTLKSNVVNGTATIITPPTISGTGTANVEQYLSTENGREWYYLASPVTGASSLLFDESDKVGYYNETIHAYTNPFESATTLTAGQGYVLNLATTNPTYIFSGALNNGDISVPVTRTGDSHAKRGFNLIGNPYPSYLNWDAVTKTNVLPTIWTRTYESSAMVFKTYNADAEIGSDDQITAHIAPLQAFWVKVPTEKGEGSFTVDFTNTLRLHKAAGDVNLRAPQVEMRRVTSVQRPMLRLQVSNGVNTDNAVMLFDDRADNSFDRFDSEKMSNDNADIPEIYTLAGTEKVVINSVSGATDGREFILGFKTGKAGLFSINATQLKNLENQPVVLKDKLQGTEFDLTTGAAYTFTSDATDNADRFSIVFAPKTVTGTPGAVSKALVYVNGNNQITVHGNTANVETVAIFNVQGQKLYEESLRSNVQSLGSSFKAGVYLVKVNGEIIKVIVK